MRHTKPRKIADDLLNPLQSVQVYLYDGEIPLENAGKETLETLTKIVGQLRRQNNDINLMWQKVGVLYDEIHAYKTRPWWRKLFGMPPKKGKNLNG